ncbi:hypothetical protein MPTK1_7g17470 [Marchantia polymorpha subsp. ruderalis]|uniref:Uncharacterized protein n=2 Tax=Marchantia polymorpha TaxID=3197 RepID=A0AAF6C0S4_MARPO|nr:hypothetical protein MARPO_0051s0084 [Marchantia polymorpha]BBN17858.1 hypothetical protein Mp_7g17470 [Marchantia polymorpha subsp. ruderalis]|eukprot:PTQ38483.1 hypothetical protein MARPO_0051s0084 [Marchantia polymorpha]
MRLTFYRVPYKNNARLLETGHRPYSCPGPVNSAPEQNRPDLETFHETTENLARTRRPSSCSGHCRPQGPLSGGLPLGGTVLRLMRQEPPLEEPGGGRPATGTAFKSRRASWFAWASNGARKPQDKEPFARSRLEAAAAASPAVAAEVARSERARLSARAANFLSLSRSWPEKSIKWGEDQQTYSTAVVSTRVVSHGESQLA